MAGFEEGSSILSVMGDRERIRSQESSDDPCLYREIDNRCRTVKLSSGQRVSNVRHVGP